MPVIGSNVGGIPLQIADDENSFLVEPTDLGVDFSDNRITKFIDTCRADRKQPIIIRGDAVDRRLWLSHDRTSY